MSRGKYWLIMIPLRILGSLISTGAFDSASNTAGILFAFFISLIIPIIQMAWPIRKRLNYLNRSQWLMLLYLLPVVGLCFMVWLGCYNTKKITSD